MTAANATPAPGPDDKLFDRHMIGISVVVVLGALMSILDTTIVNVAIDTLSRDFHTSLATIQWVSTGYMLALATVIPLSGWAADRFGTKRLYLMSITLFVAGSALCGAANSAGELIAFRVVQGLGGGMILPAGMTILSQAAGAQRMGRVMGVVGVPMLMGPVIGPILGGWLVDDVSWRWIFYVNVPVGALALVAAYRILPRDRPTPSERLDWRGVVLLSPGLAAFVYGLAQTASSGGLGQAKAYGPMAAGLALIATFTVHALRTQGPLLDLRLYRNPTMRAASLTTFLFAAAFFATMFLIPLYYQVVRHQSALHAGLLLAPQGLGAAIMMPVAGKTTDRLGAGKVVLGGMVFVILGTLGFTQVGANTSYWVLGGCQFLLGLGLGSTMMPAMSAAYSTLQHHQIARATTSLNILQRVGGSVGTALLSVILTHQLASHLSTGGGLAAAQAVPPAQQAKTAPAIADAFGNTFWWGLGLIAVAVLPALLLPRRKAPRGAETVPTAEEAVEALVG